MKLRLDLLEYLTDQDILEEAMESVHRYNPEPLFSKTGTGSFLSASIEEREKEIARTTELIRRLEERAKKHGNQNAT